MSILNKKKPGKDLRDDYLINLQSGFIITLIIMIVCFRINLQFQSEFEITHVDQDVIEMEEIIRTEQIQSPPPPPRPPAPVVVPDETIVEDVFFDLGADLDLGMPLSLPPPPPPMPDDEDDSFGEYEVFTIVEDMPILEGGMSAIYQHLRYPEIARQAGIEGRVVVQFIIDENGKVVDPVVIRGIGGGCDQAAIEAVKKVTFIPGKQRGRPVKVRYSIPIVFRLSS